MFHFREITYAKNSVFRAPSFEAKNFEDGFRRVANSRKTARIFQESEISAEKSIFFYFAKTSLSVN